MGTPHVDLVEMATWYAAGALKEGNVIIIWMNMHKYVNGTQRHRSMYVGRALPYFFEPSPSTRVLCEFQAVGGNVCMSMDEAYHAKKANSIMRIPCEELICLIVPWSLATLLNSQQDVCKCYTGIEMSS